MTGIRFSNNEKLTCAFAIVLPDRNDLREWRLGKTIEYKNAQIIFCVILKRCYNGFFCRRIENLAIIQHIINAKTMNLVVSDISGDEKI